MIPPAPHGYMTNNVLSKAEKAVFANKVGADYWFFAVNLVCSL